MFKKGGSSKQSDESKERIAKNKIKQKDNESFNKRSLEKYKESMRNLRESRKEYNYWMKQAAKYKNESK